MVIELYQEILDLNENDNLGVRLRLSSLYLKNKMLTEFKNLNDLFPNDSSCAMSFNYSLFLYATQGDNSESRKALTLANEDNKYVIPMIIGQDHSYKFNVSIDSYTLGSKEEAILYLEDGMAGWQKYEGAVD